MSVPLNRVSEQRLLKKRADYFFSARTYARSEVTSFARSLLQLGSVVVIGGFLRDLHLSGNREFRSDVDFVVDPVSVDEFERFVQQHGGKGNRFGGYGIGFDRWKVDVWPLERTWAAVHGHVAISSLNDLMKATFFDWDAVLYEVASRKVIAGQHYFEKLRHRILDINLEPNPNPFGNAVRALRYAYLWDARLGQKLATHVAKEIRDSSWEQLISYDRRSFSRPVLSGLNGNRITSCLDIHIRHGNGPVRLPVHPVQHKLPLK